MTRKRVRVGLLVGIFACIGVIGYKVAESKWRMKASEIKKDPLDLLDYVPDAALQVKEFHRTKIDKGRKVWEVSGEEARYLKAQREAVIMKPRIVFYNKKGETLEAQGSEARLFFAEQEIEKLVIQGGIEVSFQGFVFHTDEIVYLSEKNQVLSPGKVSLKGKGLELEGIGMEMDLETEQIRVLQKVKTKLRPDLLERARSRENRDDNV
jgi:LPS export ABC transporter protein LptC